MLKLRCKWTVRAVVGFAIQSVPYYNLYATALFAAKRRRVVRTRFAPVLADEGRAVRLRRQTWSDRAAPFCYSSAMRGFLHHPNGLFITGYFWLNVPIAHAYPSTRATSGPGEKRS